MTTTGINRRRYSRERKGFGTVRYQGRSMGWFHPAAESTTETEKRTA